MRTRIMSGIAVLLVAGCSDASGPREEVLINGTWHGQGLNYAGQTIVFDLTLDGTSLPRQGSAAMHDEWGHEMAHWDVRARIAGDSIFVDTQPASVKPAFEGKVSRTTITALYDRGGDNIQVVFNLVHR
jgi:hypothetical protein